MREYRGLGPVLKEPIHEAIQRGVGGAHARLNPWKTCLLPHKAAPLVPSQSITWPTRRRIAFEAQTIQEYLDFQPLAAIYDRALIARAAEGRLGR
jgi:hypothetical protein